MSGGKRKGKKESNESRGRKKNREERNNEGERWQCSKREICRVESREGWLIWKVVCAWSARGRKRV